MSSGQKPQQIIIDNFNLGGLAESKYQGQANSFAAAVGLDLHSEPGIARVNQRLVKDSGSTITARINKIVACSDTHAYLFGSSNNNASTGYGVIYQRNFTTGAYTLVHTTSDHGIITDAMEFDGWLYWATDANVGRWKIGANWNTAADTWATFTVGGAASKHLMQYLNLILYIGDGKFVSQIEINKFVAHGTISSSGTTVTGVNTLFNSECKVGGKLYYTNASDYTQERTIVTIASDTSLTIDSAFSPEPATAVFQSSFHLFSAMALDLPTGKSISSLGRTVYELLCGTQSYPWCEVYRWNTWSVSFSSNDEAPGTAVNAFLKTDNYTLVQLGLMGDLYTYSGDILQLVKRIPGDYTAGGTSWINPNAVSFYRGVPMFGVSSTNGAPAGIYSLGSPNPTLPKILNLEYPISTGNVATAEITAMERIMDATGDIMLVAWKDGTSYGVDRVDIANKIATATIDSRMVMLGRENMKTVVRITACYRDLPTNTSIGFYVSKNDAAFAAITETEVDTNRQIVNTKVSAADCAKFQIRVALNASVNTAPTLEKIIIDVI